MAALLDILKKGSVDRSVTLRIIDSTDGTPETGVAYNTAGIDLWYRREGAAKTSITEATLSALTDAHSDGGFLHVSDGEYRLDLPDAAFATGANYVDIGGTVAGMVVIGGRVRLVNYDPEDAVRAGLTALPNAAADAAGGLPISDAGGLDLDAKIGALTFTVAGDVDVNVQSWAGTAVATPDTAGYPKVTIKAGTGTGELSLSSGKVDTGSLNGRSLASLTANGGANIVTFFNDGGSVTTAEVSMIGTTQTNAEAVKTLAEGASGFAAIKAETASILEDTGTTLPGTLVTIAGYIDTEVAAIKSVVDAILVDTAEIGAAGAGLTNLPWNASWDAEVESEVNDGLVAIHLDHLLAADYDPTNKPGTSTALLNEVVENDGGVSRFTANALEQAPGGGSGSGTATVENQETIIKLIQAKKSR